MHIESYQLTQLEQCGIKPLKKNIKALPRNRVILYPEASITKSKWHYENFIELYYTLKGHGVETHIFESFGLNLPIAEKIVIEDLADVKTFFDSGGIFVSNDSGMAHFAGFCGLLTITIFSDFDSSIWHPRGENISLRLGYDNVVATELVDTIYRCLAEETE
jgi:ADP-heptose:LPS heptosyltransferase